MKKLLFTALALLTLSIGARSQVTIGSTDIPQEFSILELVSNSALGLRLPQMTFAQRNAMVATEDFQDEKSGKALGLQIFNTTTKCVETWNGTKWIKQCGEPPVERIEFTIETTDGTFSIPTSGYLNGTSEHSYNWDIFVDDEYFDSKTGIGGTSSAGIPLDNLSSGRHKIMITYTVEPFAGWGNAFGFYRIPSGANAQDNKNKIISVDASLTTMAFAPKDLESTTSASYMFAYIFYDCKNLEKGVKIIDTYKLPGTITDLSSFLFFTHFNNTALTAPVNLNGLSGWFSGNNSITDLSKFLNSTHFDNTALTTPVDLSEISEWFSGNSSITNLSEFIYGTHSGNTALTAPVDLSGISGWFSGNNSITDLSKFLSSTHEGNTTLTSPVNLNGLSGWFSGNSSITILSDFLSSTHYGNTALTSPVDLNGISGWFSGNSSITDLSNFLYATHYNNIALTAPVNLIPLAVWFSENRNFSYGSYFLSRLHYNNFALKLEGQKIFPDWIKSMTVNGVDIVNAYCAFNNIFYCNSPKTDDTGEPKFEDGSSVLSSIGNPENSNQAYTNRTDINQVNSKWK